MRLNLLKIAFSAPTPLFYVVTPRTVFINLQVKTMVPFARHLCCNVEHINTLQFQKNKH